MRIQLINRLFKSKTQYSFAISEGNSSLRIFGKIKLTFSILDMIINKTSVNIRFLLIRWNYSEIAYF